MQELIYFLEYTEYITYSVIKRKIKHLPFSFLCHICFSELQVYAKFDNINIAEDRETILILLVIQTAH